MDNAAAAAIFCNLHFIDFWRRRGHYHRWVGMGVIPLLTIQTHCNSSIFTILNVDFFKTNVYF